jgi:hypothetical protein
MPACIIVLDSAPAALPEREISCGSPVAAPDRLAIPERMIRGNF